MSAERNSCRTKGRAPASAFHSAASTPRSESTTLTDSKFDADPLGDLGIEALDALVLGAQLVAPLELVPDAGKLVAGIGIEGLQPRGFLELGGRFFQPAEVGERKAEAVPSAVDARVDLDGALEARQRRFMAPGALQDEGDVEVRGRIGRTERERALEGVDRGGELLALGEQEGDAGPRLLMPGILPRHGAEHLQRPGLALEEHQQLPVPEKERRAQRFVQRHPFDSTLYNARLAEEPGHEENRSDREAVQAR